MSSAPPKQSTQDPQGGYPPPGGPASGAGAPAGQPPPAGPGAYAPPGGAPQGQQPYSPYPPPGAYGAYPGSYYPPPGQYYAPPGQYPYAGYYPPPGQYAPQYAPPPGQYAPPPGQYPPPAGQYPPPVGVPGAPAAAAAPAEAPSAGAAGAASPPPGQYPPPVGQYPPPAGQYPPPGGQYPPPAGQYAPPAPQGGPFGMPASPGYPAAAPGFYPPPVPQHIQDPLVYLGTAIPDPSAPPAAHGAQKVPGYDPAPDYNALVRAISGDVGDEKKRKLTMATDMTKTVLQILTPLNVFQMDALNDYCVAKSGVKLADRLEKVTSGNFGIAIRALALGPLGYDVDLAHKAIIGIGTNEMLLMELVLGRPGHEIRWLKTAYRLRYGRDLVDEIKADLSGKTEKMFMMALNTQKPFDSPYGTVDQLVVDVDIENLHVASKRRDEIAFCEVLVNRSDSHLAAVITGFSLRYKSLSKVIKKTFSGTIETALLYVMHGVKPKRDRQGFWRDAKLLEKTMAGLGTKDTTLIYRLVRAHWSPQRMEAIKDSYKRRYGKTLEHRVKGETSGPYRDLLVVLVKSSEPGAGK